MPKVRSSAGGQCRTDRRLPASCARSVAARKRPLPRRASAVPALTASASGLVPSTCSTSNAPAGPLGSAPAGVQAVGHQDRRAAARCHELQLRRRGPQRACEVGDAVPSQRQQIVDDPVGRHLGAEVSQHQRLGRERDHGGAQPIRRRVHDGRRGDRGQRDRAAGHRARAIDQQAHGPGRRAPRSGDDPVGPIRPPSLRQLQRAIEVEVTGERTAVRDQPSRAVRGSGRRPGPAAAAAAAPAAARRLAVPGRSRPPCRPTARPLDRGHGAALRQAPPDRSPRPAVRPRRTPSARSEADHG